MKRLNSNFFWQRYKNIQNNPKSTRNREKSSVRDFAERTPHIIINETSNNPLSFFDLLPVSENLGKILEKWKKMRFLWSMHNKIFIFKSREANCSSWRVFHINNLCALVALQISSLLTLECSVFGIEWATHKKNCSKFSAQSGFQSNKLCFIYLYFFFVDC